jgi:hypothetical protein
VIANNLHFVLLRVQDDINNEQTLKMMEEAIEYNAVLKDAKGKKKAERKKCRVM